MMKYWFHVGGLTGPDNEILNWIQEQPLCLGDEIVIEVKEVEIYTEPKSRSFPFANMPSKEEQNENQLRCFWELEKALREKGLIE